jgi:integrase
LVRDHVIRRRGRTFAVEVYDGARKSRKRYVGTYTNRADAKAAERAASEDVARGRGRKREETVAGWAARWLELRPRPKEATNIAYREQTKNFVEEHGSARLRAVDAEMALEWLSTHRWTLGGMRAFFTDAKRAGLVDANPFAGLGLAGSRGRKDLAVLTVDEVRGLVDAVDVAWSGQIAVTMRALILTLAYVGLRPAEAYGLRWDDLDLQEGEVLVERQYSPKAQQFTAPKNGQSRRIVVPPDARDALAHLPRPLDGREAVFRTARGGLITGQCQHYYWNPVRVAAGRPTMELYELRHFCGAWLFNTLELPAQDVAAQLGHTDGGRLVMALYGHPSAELARDRIKRATAARPSVVPILAPHLRDENRKGGAA